MKMKLANNISISYNSKVILTLFFLSLFALLINKITRGKSNKLFFSTYRSSALNPLTYLRLITHIIGHSNWNHLIHNYLYILLIGPMIEEKYTGLILLKMIILTALITGIIHNITSKNVIIEGSSGIVFMLITLSSIVNIETKSIPITLILIFIFYIIEELTPIISKKKDNISHKSHIIGALSGIIYGLYLYKL